MQRKTASETVARKRERTIRLESEPLRERIAAWASDHVEQLAALDLAPLEELPDRQADIWEPLTGIAHIAGEAWFVRACSAARRLQPDSDDSNGVRLLSDLRDAFDKHGDKLFSEMAVDFLNALEEAPWPEWRGKPLTKNGLANLLKRFEVRPHSVRVGEETKKGYDRQTFEPIFARYLPTPPNETSQRHTALPMRDSGDVRPSQTEAGVTFQNGRDPNGHAGCDVVTVQTGEASETELDEACDFLLAELDDGNRHPAGDFFKDLTPSENGRIPISGDPDFADWIDQKLQEGHITETEWLDRRKLHALVESRR